ncbi:MAG: hypothetical protein GX577_06220, partial [Leptolinea sp.]|nr:hypothetical protein [Leptolinea sp.]
MHSKIFRSPFELFLVIGILIAHIYVSLAPANSLMNWFTTDDAFYYFKTAQNIGLGNDISFDGISRTNGFHPLWMVICVPIFLLANTDLILPLRIVILLAGLMNAVTVVLIWRMFKQNEAAFAGVVAALFWAFSIRVHTITVTLGMESTVNALTVTLLVYMAAQLDIKRENGSLRENDFLNLGITAIFTFLSRIDNGFVILAVLLWALFKHFNSMSVAGETKLQAWQRRLKVALLLGLPVAITVGAYLGFNKLYFGTEMPVSGQIKRWWGTLPNTVYGFPVDNYKVFLTHLITPQVNIGPFALATQTPHDIADFIEGLIKFQGDQKTIHRILVLISSIILMVISGFFIMRNWKRFMRLVDRF